MFSIALSADTEEAGKIIQLAAQTETKSPDALFLIRLSGVGSRGQQLKHPLMQ